MAQYAVPVADRTVGSWQELGGNGDAFAYNELDDLITRGDGHDGAVTSWRSFLFSTPGQDLMRFEITSLTDPGVHDRHVMKAVVRNPTGLGTIAANLVLKAYVTDDALPQQTIATLSRQITGTGWVTMSYELTTNQAGSIWDYGRMWMEMIAVNAGAVQTRIDCTALEFFCPLGNQPKQTVGIGLSEIEQYTIAATPTYFVGVKWDTVSSTLVSSGGFVLKASWNRTLAHVLEDISPGDATVILDNADGRFSPENPDSPYAGLMLPNRELDITVAYQGSLHHLFNGVIESYAVKPELGKRTTAIDATDRMGVIKDRILDMPLRTEINVGSLVSEVLSHAGITAAQMNVDPINDVVPWASFGGEKANQALEDIIQVGDYKCFVNGAGIVQFRGRYYDVEGLTVGSHHEFHKFNYTFDGEDVSNRITIKSSPKKVRTSVGTVGAIDESIAIPALQTITFELDYVDTDDDNSSRVPANSVTISTYTGNVNSDGSGANKTAALVPTIDAFAKSAVASVYNSDSAQVYLTAFALQGYSLQDLAEISVTVDESSSQAVYGIREFEIESEMITRYRYISDYAVHLVRDMMGTVAKVDASVKNAFDAVYRYELGDIITLVETVTRVGSDYTLVGMAHTVRPNAGLEHTMEMDIRMHLDKNWLILDHDPRGRLDLNRLGF